MTVKKTWYFFTCLCFTLSESFSVDTLQRCGIKDMECQKKLYQHVIKEVGQPGVPELNIPPLDPIALKNVGVGILNVANLTLVDGTVKGIKDCIVNSYEIDIEKGIGKQEIMCDFIIKGHYVLSDVGEILKGMLNTGEIRGDGKGKIKLEKLVLTIKFPLHVIKKDDGEIYFVWHIKGVEYDYDVKGKASFAADNVFVGKADISEFVIKYLNENWKYLLKTFGRPFVGKAMEYYFDFAQKFFGGIPAKRFITDDLTPYLKN